MSKKTEWTVEVKPVRNARRPKHIRILYKAVFWLAMMMFVFEPLSIVARDFWEIIVDIVAIIFAFAVLGWIAFPYFEGS